MTISVTEGLREKLIASLAKRTELSHVKDSLVTLAVGSSHGEHGFNPAGVENSFNLCSSSQDLKHSYLLYEHAIALCPALENLVVFYSIFSSGSFLERSPSEREWSVALNEAFHLGLHYDDPLLNVLSTNISGKLDRAVVVGAARGFPPLGGGFFPQAYGAAKRAHDHLRFNQRNDAIGFMYSIAALARLKKHKMVVVIPPARSDYRNATGQVSEHLFKNLHTFLETTRPYFPVTLLDLYSDPQFTDDLFGDFDHLNHHKGGPLLVAQALASALSIGPVVSSPAS